MEKVIQKWKDEFAFCEEQEANNFKNKEYIIAHNHAVRKEQIREFIKDLEEVKIISSKQPVSGSFPCPCCELKFTDESILESHVNRYHNQFGAWG